MEHLRRMQAGDDVRTESLRALGGLLLGIGVLVLLYRKTSFAEPWGDFAVFVALLLPALLLYGGGILAARSAEPRAWHSVWVVFGIVFVLSTLQQFLTLIDGDVGAPLNVAWTFGVVAAIAVVAALFARVRFGWLLAGIALTVSWFALWDQILEDGLGEDAGTFRGLAMVAALLLFLAAFMLARRERTTLSEASELVTAGGLVFLLGAGIISLSGAIVAGISGAIGPAGTVTESGGVEPSFFWDLVLLVGSVGLVGLGSLVSARGPMYVGVLGIGIFITIVGADLDDDSPAGAVVGWPLILLLVGVAAVAASGLGLKRSALASESRRDR